jgi:hypothetical protein
VKQSDRREKQCAADGRQERGGKRHENQRRRKTLRQLIEAPQIELHADREADPPESEFVHRAEVRECLLGHHSHGPEAKSEDQEGKA